ncbi:10485_t:CDS:1 [Dentiscutata erythropus]|uniref:10485_t:CDS:1 n=1 Tax=Dentiscutata erythropus TaxID=1348616 RepID=A0A9N9JSV2_9GLOM|nr:10485_t:CDS:1 [Dentiscutata erythropus]
MNKKKSNPSLKIQNNPEDQNLIVPVYVDQKFEFSDEIKNVNDVYAFQHFVKILCQNISNFDKQRGKDNIQYSLYITSKTFLDSKYNYLTNLWTNMKYFNINILFILVKNHEHVSHMEELFGNVIITIDLIYDLTFRYQLDNIQEFTTIFRKFNLQTFLNICENHKNATIYDKTSLNSYFNVKNIKVKKRTLMEYQTKLTQEEIDILIFRYLKAGKYIRKWKLRGGFKPKNYINQKKYFNAQTLGMIEDTVKKFSIILASVSDNFSSTI